MTTTSDARPELDRAGGHRPGTASPPAAPAPPPTAAPATALSPWAAVAVLVAVAIGAALRNAWAADLEWKYDQQWMFDAAQAVGRTAPWPWIGMPSGVGTPNPGLSVWIFVALARLVGAVTPVDLGRAVMLLNSAALAGLAAFALRRQPREREPWLWATALGAVNPGAVIHHRCIWAQSVLPAFSLLALAGWWHRRRPWGALVWGLGSALLGQIHMTGLFFTAAFVLWTLAFDRAPPRPRWGLFALGFCAGGWPLVPWVRLGLLGGGPARGPSWYDPITFQFWYWWLRDLTGLHTEYSLGWRDFATFASEPRIAGLPTFAVAALLAVSIGCVATALAWGWRAVRARGIGAALRDPAPTSLAQNAALVAFGALLTPVAGVYPHYLLVAFPLGYVALARAALTRPAGGRRLLALVVLAHLGIAAMFLIHIHREGGARGDYGRAYSRQLR
jgi:hypothetical protein